MGMQPYGKRSRPRAGLAANPERWRQRLLQRAARGPQPLHPHERGQVVHLAMTEDGARSIAQAKLTLAASSGSVPSTQPSAMRPPRE